MTRVSRVLSFFKMAMLDSVMHNISHHHTLKMQVFGALSDANDYAIWETAGLHIVQERTHVEGNCMG